MESAHRGAIGPGAHALKERRNAKPADGPPAEPARLDRTRLRPSSKPPKAPNTSLASCLRTVTWRRKGRGRTATTPQEKVYARHFKTLDPLDRRSVDAMIADARVARS